MEMALRMRRICDRLANFPAPVIAALNGHALGGGAEVAVAAEVDEVVPRPSFESSWRELARSLANRPAREIKRLTRGEVPVKEAARAFARLWVADEHWEAAEKVMSRAR